MGAFWDIYSLDHKAEALETLADAGFLPTLERQRARDIAGALRAEADAQRSMNAAVSAASCTAHKLSWNQWRRTRRWPCPYNAPYCSHMPACRNLVGPP